MQNRDIAETQDTRDTQKALIELTDILDRDIETIVDMRMAAERTVNRQQRFIERATSGIGRPTALYLIFVIVLLWIIFSNFHSNLGLPNFDPSPFNGLQDVVNVSALLTTIAILITQNRQAKMAEQRRHLDLQITLLTERKVSKLIELVEGIRRDSPTIEDLKDTEAQAMKEPVDPHTALTSLNKTLQNAAKEHKVSVD